FAMSCVQPATKREAFKRTGISQKQIQRRIAAAEDLCNFLGRLQTNGRIALANEMPNHVLFPWRSELLTIADWLRGLGAWQPDPLEAGRALVLHVGEVTGKRRLDFKTKNYVLDMLEAARDTVGATKPALTLDSFDKALRRTPRAKAESLLRG